jgi:Fur family peroxide stress response transcriptional regulator
VRKSSKQRDCIRDNLAHRTDHPTADMIFHDIRQEYPNVSLGTVYRNLALLEKLGEIQKLSCSDGAVRYDGNIHPHMHFQCRVCGRVYDLPGDYPERILREAQKAAPDELFESCSVTFTGVCRECRDKGLETETASRMAENAM